MGRIAKGDSGSQNEGEALSKPRLLWIGDAVAHTGFATVTHSILEHLRHTWDVSVLGINYCGDPHDYPYPIYPAMVPSIPSSDQWGLKRCLGILAKTRPDVVCVNNDPWNVAMFAHDIWAINKLSIPLVAYMPVDSRHMNERRMKALSPNADGVGLALAIWYTEFAKREAESAGYSGRSAVIPHGVDCERFKPMDRDECRREIFPSEAKDMYVIGNVNRNQFRKRQDLLFDYVDTWIGDNDKLREKVLLYFHCPSSHPEGWDLTLMARRHKLRTAWAVKSSFEGCDPSVMAKVYGAFDIQATTTLGEGWGLTTHEGLACGIPEIYPAFAALGEWVPRTVHTTYAVPTDAKLCYSSTHHVGEAPSKERFVEALRDAYYCWEYGLFPNREFIAQSVGPRFRPEWDWKNIAARFDKEFRSVLPSVARDDIDPVTVEEQAVA